MYNRFGLITDDERLRWYFSLKEARMAAERLKEKGIPFRIIGGTLVNDEGCTPYIRRGETLERL